MWRNETNAKEIRATFGLRRASGVSLTRTRAENADVILYTVEGGGHTWPGGKPLVEWWAGRTTSEVNATRVMWAFFIQHPRGPK
jgi:polyhydroxybutyrate depolymerase